MAALEDALARRAEEAARDRLEWAERLQGARRAHDERSQELENALEGAAARSKQLEADVEEARRQLLEARAENAVVQAKLGETIELLTLRTGEAAELRATAEVRQAEAVTLREALTRAEGQLAQAGARISTLQELLDKRKGQATQAIGEAEELRAKVEMLQLESADATARTLARAHAEERLRAAEEREVQANRSKGQQVMLAEELSRVRAQAEAREGAWMSSSALQTQMNGLLQRKVEALEAALERERTHARDERARLTRALQSQPGTPARSLHHSPGGCYSSETSRTVPPDILHDAPRISKGSGAVEWASPLTCASSQRNSAAPTELWLAGSSRPAAPAK